MRSTFWRRRTSARFSGKTVLITGASSGIGAALAREFARQGARVILSARRLERIESLAREINAGGGTAYAFACDVTQDRDVDSLIAAIRLHDLPIDILVANAGFAVSGKFQDLSLEDYRLQFETNVFGVLRTVRASLAALRRTRGCIVLIGSVAGHVPSPRQSAYSMSKFAVRALAQGLRGDLRGEGIAVTLISPGYIDSDIRRTDNRGRVHASAADPAPAWLRVPTPAAARAIVAAVYRHKREQVITGHGKLLVWLYRHFPWTLYGALDRGRHLRRD